MKVDLNMESFFHPIWPLQKWSPEHFLKMTQVIEILNESTNIDIICINNVIEHPCNQFEWFLFLH